MALALALALSLAPNGLTAQPEHSIAIRYTLYNYGTTLGSDNFDFGDVFGLADHAALEVAYYNKLLPNLFLAVPLKVGQASYPLEGSTLMKDYGTINLDALLQYHFLKYGAFLNPYIHAGVGTNVITPLSEFGVGFPVGIGVNIKTWGNVYLNAQTQYRFSLNDRDGWHHGIGLHFFLDEGDGDDMALGSDSDGDGILDMLDSCPEIPGPASNRGCPELTKEDKEKVELAINMVQFETAKSVLLSQSFPVLDNIADIMKRYPYYNLRINGHTDNVGDDASNLKLSKERAKACYDYLVSKGVASGRMSHEGYGESRPRADNNTDQGRALNRRVEFELIVE